jgi:uncharacterized protein (TIGR00288 family)
VQGVDANVSSDRIAVLIDADNTSHTYAEAFLDEIAKFGNPTIKRAYGDWTSDRLKGWGNELNLRAIRGMHQGAFTRGKNSTDSAMIIDAMDLLYAGNVEAFALVTSDSDFTSLALRLRESGKVVYGLGEKKTPASLQNACDKFIRLESLGDPDTASGSPDSDTSGDEPDLVPEVNLQSALTKAVNAVGGDDGWAAPGAIGQHLSRTHPSLDPRNYEHRGLQGLLAAQPYLETSTEGGSMLVRVKGRAPSRTAGKKQAASKATPSKAASSGSTAQKADAPQADAPKSAAPKSAAPKSAGRKTAGRKAAAPKTGAPKTGAPKTEAPQPEVASSEVPKVTTTTRSARKAAAAKKT